ncbi:DUF2889 domain-containing protein [Pelotomaculum isophthalicicum JI]|uniref:DUF2889 domain-containing protein n=1 Tax=Pelotomaculum isophthalicicum JI TaxID=947010 RepID=A0A9X4JSV7_9FIRM|nr:DUF2889 domain-containing protein [Pelotomaculum isophthalicicum]MDF9407509.1 DUF2889 domain-containing protein [Pelotomaculum isophthalicicum JI]
MKILYQSNSFSTVKVNHGDELLVNSSLISTDFEAVGQMVTDLKSFRIKKARWDIYRSPDGSMNGGKELPELAGVEAYFSAGGFLRRVVGDEAGGLPRELLAECVKGLIQAETFVFIDRGYPSAKAYEDYWDEIYLNACRYYSNLERIARRWFDYVGYCHRERNLFNRFLCCRVCGLDNGHLTASGSFSDSFHELGVCVDLNDGGTVVDCTGNFLRAPDQVCFENREHVLKLIGKKIARMEKKEIGELVGGPHGCNHLVDIVHGIGKAVAVSLGMNREI